MKLIESPINYMGSKYKLLDRLIPLFPKADTFVDLFAGGGSVYMNVNHLYKNVLANFLSILFPFYLLFKIRIHL